jgi:hypothetical protein
MLFLAFATVTPLAQAQSLTTPGQPKNSIPHGDYVVVYRTPAHIKLSSRSVFEQVKDSVIEYLAVQSVHVVKVEEMDLSALREENLEITEISSIPDVFQKARLAGASHVLLVTVDRPLKSWLKLTFQCSDLSGEKLWEEEAANSTALSGGSGLRSTLKRVEARLAARIGQPGLVVENHMNGSSGQNPVATVPSEVAEVQTGTSSTKIGEPPQTSMEEQASVTLPAGTIVRLMLMQPINSANAKVGDALDFRVIEDIKAGDLVVIPRKSAATGLVTELQPPQRRGKPGRITIRAESVQLINNETVALSGLRTLKSANRNVSLETQAEAYDLIQSTGGFGVFFLPLFMLKHGEYPVLPAGMEFTTALSQAVTVQRTELVSLQPIEEKRHGNPVVTVYHISNPPGDRPKLYCGNAEVARLEGGTQFVLELPPGKYWFRSNSKKNAVSLLMEEGGEYYLRVESVMTWGNPQNPGFSQFLNLRDHDIGELEASEQAPLDVQNIKELSKIDIARLSAAPN